jgi:hypothetical protein
MTQVAVTHTAWSRKNHTAAAIAGTRAIITSSITPRVDRFWLICGAGETVILLNIELIPFVYSQMPVLI